MVSEPQLFVSYPILTLIVLSTLSKISFVKVSLYMIFKFIPPAYSLFYILIWTLTLPLGVRVGIVDNSLKLAWILASVETRH